MLIWKQFHKELHPIVMPLMSKGLNCTWNESCIHSACREHNCLYLGQSHFPQWLDFTPTLIYNCLLIFNEIITSWYVYHSYFFLNLNWKFLRTTILKFLEIYFEHLFINRFFFDQLQLYFVVSLQITNYTSYNQHS